MPKDLNLSWLVRYGFGGALLYVILLLAYPVEVKKYTEAAGTVLAPILVLAGGACIYVVYRHLLGEWLLYPIGHFFDYLTSKGNRHPNVGAVSTIWWLAQRGVAAGARREAYTALRREFLPQPTRVSVDLAHSEVHILYLTFLELFVLGSGLLWKHGQTTRALALSIAGIASLIAAWAADVRLHRHEFRTIVPQDQVKRAVVETFLRDRGYIQ